MTCLERTLKTRWYHPWVCHLFSTYHSKSHSAWKRISTRHAKSKPPKKKKEASSFGNEPPWLVLPLQQPITLWDSCISSLLSARPTDARLAAPVDRWILQVTSQHREACWDTWLFFCASRLPKFAFITHQKGSERKKGVQCGAVVDCGSSEGGKSSQGLEKQLSGLLSTRVQQFTEVRGKKRV